MRRTGFQLESDCRRVSPRASYIGTSGRREDGPGSCKWKLIKESVALRSTVRLPSGQMCGQGNAEHG